MRADLIPIVVGTDGLYLDMSRLDGHRPEARVGDDLTDAEHAWRTSMAATLASARDVPAVVPNFAEGWPKRVWPPWASSETGAPDRVQHPSAGPYRSQARGWFDNGRDEGDLVDDGDHLFGGSLFGDHDKVERAMRQAERAEENYGAVVSILRDLFVGLEGCTVDLGTDGDDPSGVRRVMVSMPPNVAAGFAAMLLDAGVESGVNLHCLKLPLTRPYAQFNGVYFEPELHVFVDPRDVRAHRWHLSRWREGCRDETREFKFGSVLHAFQPGTYFDAERVNHYGRGTGCFVFPTDDGWSKKEYEAATVRVETVDTVGAASNL